MRDAMVFRGPDGYGLTNGPGYALGHRRLSIIDLSPQGSQPMSNEDGSVEIVFNGEIYNFKEVASELRAHNHRFRSRTDTEVLLHGFEQWGMKGLLKRIRGMFAFAILDHRAQEIHLARDPLGKKPLFFQFADGELVFASSARVLALGLRTLPDIDPFAIGHLLWNMHIPGPRSIFSGIEKLRPGHALSLGPDGQLRDFVHWEPDFLHPEHNVTENEWLERIEAALKEAVARRLVADVPVGILLSGGVDSSLVTGIATTLTSGVRTFSVATDDPALDETVFAEAVARRCGTNHQVLEVRGECRRHLPQLMAAMAEPLADPSAINVITIAAQAREFVKVVLTGDGGDEGFGGYQHYFAHYVAGRLRQIGRGHLRYPLALLGSNLPRQRGVLRRVATLFRLASASIEDTLFTDSLVMDSLTCDSLYTADFKKLLMHSRLNQHYLDALPAKNGTSATDVDRVMQMQMRTILPDDYLAKVDSGTMAVSLEARCPLLDIDVVELAMRIPAACRFSRWKPKSLLRRLALGYVPTKCVMRPKKGFVAPIGRWLRDGSWSDLARDLILGRSLAERGWFDRQTLKRVFDEHQQGIDHGYLLWALVVLEWWLRMTAEAWTTNATSHLSAPPASGDAPCAHEC